MKRGVLVLALVTAAVFAGGNAHAQSSTPAYVRSRLAIGQTVWVTTASQGTLQGTVAAINDSRFEVSMLGRVESYSWVDIRLIEVRDSIRNGATIGAIIGSLALANVPGSRSAGNILPYAALGAAIGGIAGGYADYLREGREIILRNSVVAGIGPIVQPRTLGAVVILSW